MEEVCTCKGCNGGQKWIIYTDRIECAVCKKTYSFFDYAASDLVNLTNDNY